MDVASNFSLLCAGCPLPDFVHLHSMKIYRSFTFLFCIQYRKMDAISNFRTVCQVFSILRAPSAQGEMKTDAELQIFPLEDARIHNSLLYAGQIDVLFCVASISGTRAILFYVGNSLFRNNASVYSLGKAVS